MADGEGKCSLCGETDHLTASGRCSECMGVHSLGETGVVSSFLRYGQDPAAQMLLQTTGGATLKQVGESLGITRERVRQIEGKALKKLRIRLERQGLSLADLMGDREGVGHGRAPTAAPRPRELDADDGVPSRGSVSWARAGSIRSRDAGPMPEELYSPEGVRLAEGVLELEQRAARIAQLLERMPPAPIDDAESAQASIPGAQERTEEMAAITWNGETKSVRQWAEAFAVTEQAIYTRLKRGRNVDGSVKDAPADTPPLVPMLDGSDREPETFDGRPVPDGRSEARVAELLRRVEQLEAKLVEAPAAVDLGPRDVGARGPTRDHLALEVLELAGIEGVRVVSCTARGELIWVPAA